jgi:hypothetical protein
MTERCTIQPFLRLARARQNATARIEFARGVAVPQTAPGRPYVSRPVGAAYVCFPRGPEVCDAP